MPHWFLDLNAMEQVFAVCAILGGFFFLIRVVTTFMGADDADGGDGDVDIDGEVDGDIDGDGSTEASDGHADIAFRLLSFQGLTAFFMMFGLAGLALSRGSGVAQGWAVGGAMLAGLLSVWVLTWIYSLFNKIQSSGTIKMSNAVGEEGTVYLTIPKGDTGKVTLTLQGRQGTYNAVSENSEKIATDAAIEVVKVISGNILVVKTL